MYVSCNRCSSNNVCCAAIIIVRSNVVRCRIVFHRKWGILLILTIEPHHAIFSSDASRRETPTNVQPDERDIGISERKRPSEREGEREREIEYEWTCVTAVRDPMVFQNRFLVIVTRNAVMPSNTLWTPEVWVWSRKAVLHNLLSSLFTRLDITRAHQKRTGHHLTSYSRGRFSRSWINMSPSQFSITLEERPSKGENCSIIIRFPFSLFSYLYIIPQLWHNTVHHEKSERIDVSLRQTLSYYNNNRASRAL